MKFDYKDELILNLLEKNAKLTVQEIAKKTKITQTTVFNRIKKLEKDNVLLGYFTKINRKKIGKEILKSFVLIGVDYQGLKNKGEKQNDLAKEISNLQGVEEVSIVTGGTDIIIKIHVENIANLNELVLNKLREIEGVQNTKISLVLEEF